MQILVYSSSQPVFHKGILYTNRQCNKRQLLTTFFEYLNWFPAKVIFFDDYQEQVKAGAHEKKKLNI